MEILIKQYAVTDLATAASVLADAFVTDSLHVAAFGPQRPDQNQLFFQIGLEHMFTNHAHVAFVDGELHGYIHYVSSPSCFPPPHQLEAAAESVLRPLGDAVPRVVEWFSSWSHYDPAEPHIHLGPIGVSSKVQGHGVGAALMKHYVDHLETEGAAGYLETTSMKNVDFYRKFGFVVQHQEDVLGTPNWYMWRPKQG